MRFSDDELTMLRVAIIRQVDSLSDLAMSDPEVRPSVAAHVHLSRKLYEVSMREGKEGQTIE